MTEMTLDERREARLEAAFRLEELAGLRLANRARLVALVVVAVWLFFWTRPPETFFLEVVMILLWLNGVAHYRLRRRRRDRPWAGYLCIALDFALVTFAVIGLALVHEGPRPPQMALRDGAFVYFFVFLALVALSGSTRLMLWAGASGALAWSAGVLWLATRPDSLTAFDHGGLTEAERLAQHLDSRFVNTVIWQQEVVTLLVAAGVLATAVWRSRRLARRQADAERRRSNLARYFSPDMVDRLAERDRPLEAYDSRTVAVLFADIVGFTQVCEFLEPEKVIGLLRDFHGRMAAAVFEHGGTVDKYIGDSIMATFGTALAGPQDATHALACARTMLAEMDAWNRERWAQGYQPIRVGIGIHFGPAVLGDIGGEWRFEYAVVGDTVNVASRLEALTRDLGVDIAASDDLVRQVREEGGQAVLEGFVQGLPQQLPGREQPLAVWTWRGAD